MSQNIQSAWRPTGLIPYNSAIVFHKLSIYPHYTVVDAIFSTSNTNDHNLVFNTQLQTRYFVEQILLTSANIKEVSEVEEFVSFFQNSTSNLKFFTRIQKQLGLLWQIEMS